MESSVDREPVRVRAKGEGRARARGQGVYREPVDLLEGAEGRLALELLLHLGDVGEI